ncbi:putative replication-association protein [Mongoose-associated circovirus]|nr:putative replication-association protein [Mongoose-associated circovirus]
MPPAQCKAWMFTINNPTDRQLPTEWQDDVAYAVWQLEVGTNGTPHLQGYLQMKKKCRLAAMKKVHPSAHWEVRHGTHEEALAYCSKEDTRQDGPWTYGTPTTKAGQRNDLLAMKKALDEGQSEKEIAMNPDTFPVWAKYFRALERYNRLTGKKSRNWPTQTIVYWGPPGTGKSSRALREGGLDSFWLPKPQAHGSVWWDGYDGQEVVVIDEFYGWIPRDLMCRLCDRCDRYPLCVETKGGSVPFIAKKIIITSNSPPDQWWKIGLGAMERRLTPPLGSITEIATLEMTGDQSLYQAVQTMNLMAPWEPLTNIPSPSQNTCPPTVTTSEVRRNNQTATQTSQTRERTSGSRLLSFLPSNYSSNPFCYMCETERVSEEGELCDSCFPSNTELYDME